MEETLVYFVVQAIVFLVPAWRIFRKAGFEPAIGLLVLVPFVGPMIAMAILAIANWPANAAADYTSREDA